MNERLETWAGVECTVNRVGDTYSDQSRRSGHHDRETDLARLAALGVSAVRYPVLWERVERDGWAWSDRRLQLMRDLGLRPIVGLLHHGSGPERTSLIDPGFPAAFAEHAAACAERYPWVRDWTPVNEPLTTARFSGLYGVWYPHGRDLTCFVRALLGQCQATALAMRRIRAIIPDARLVQTEDLGQTWSTPEVAAQADFENLRRWLSLDLLTGRIDPEHPMYDWLLKAGATAEELAEFVAHPCPPDIMGINNYVTSERWLDHRLDMYPPETHGDNGEMSYADVESVRAGPLAGRRALLRAAWERYGIPLAITEVHLYSTRDEQLRWLNEAFGDCHALREDGVDLRAITAWGAFGLFDWDSLVTCNRGHYEPGLFDVRGREPRPTILARRIAAAARGEPFDHPVLDAPGWWRRAERIFYPAVPVVHAEIPADARPLLVTGARGALGTAIGHRCAHRGLPCVLLGRDELDLGDSAAIRAAILKHKPWAVVNAAGYASPGGAERDPERCWRDNYHAAVNVAAAARAAGIPSVAISSAQVFAGERRDQPWVERDRPAPANAYGAAKAAAEAAILAIAPDALIVRSSAFFSPWDERGPARIARALAAGDAVTVPDAATISPTHVPDLVDAFLDLLIDGESGIWHIANDGACTWQELATAIAALVDADPALVSTVERPAHLPAYSALTSERGVLLRPWRESLGVWWKTTSEGERPPVPTLQCSA